MVMSVTVGICAYNEEANIGRCIESVLAQRVEDFDISEVIVVSSGSTDRTDEIVNEYVTRDERVVLIRQEGREGKNSAINMIMERAGSPVIAMVNADNVLTDSALKYLLEPFKDSHVGMVGGHPIPVNDRDTWVGFTVHMLWDMHHRLSLIHPKIGELVAFRNLGIVLPTDTQSDEDIIRIKLEGKGFGVKYAPKAIVLNKGPTDLSDLLKQRTRVNIGEQHMMRSMDYDIPTWDKGYLFRAFQSFLRDNRTKLPRIVYAMSIEAYARTYAKTYVLLGRKDKNVWERVATTKDL